MAAQLNSFKQLKIGDRGRPIEIRVIRKWILKLKQTYLCCIFTDRQGNAVQSFTIEKDISSVDSRLNLMKCYKISDYACAEPMWSVTVVPADYNMRIGSFTTITTIGDLQDIPTEYYNFCDPKMFDDPMLQSNMIEDKETKEGRPYVVLTVLDNSRKAQQVKLWEEIITQPSRFNREIINKTPPPVILGFTALKTNIYKGIFSLLSTAATHVYIHPNHPLTNELLKRLQDEDLNLALITTQGTPTTIASLLQQNEEQLLGKTFLCEASIHDYDLSNGWYYTKCPQCGAIIWDTDNNWLCTSDGYIDKPNCMYRIIANIIDDTGSVQVTLFDDTTSLLTGKSCDNIVINDGYKDRKAIPPELAAAVGNNKKFSIKAQKDAGQSVVRFTVKKIIHPPSLLNTPEQETEISLTMTPPTTGIKRKLQFDPPPSKRYHA